jgi:hypothetical protein
MNYELSISVQLQYAKSFYNPFLSHQLSSQSYFLSFTGPSIYIALFGKGRGIGSGELKVIDAI